MEPTTVESAEHPPVLEVRELRTTFDTEAGLVSAVDGVSLCVPQGKTVALVGESGCGKSVTALSIMRLIPQPPGCIAGGEVWFTESGNGETIDLLALTDRQMRTIRGRHIAMIFQEPQVSLNPVFTVGEQIAEAVELHQSLRGRAARDAAVRMLRQVGIAAPEQRISEYPHQLSGGMQQRVMIAMALCGHPSLLIADEPTTALDVTVQSQILGLLGEFQARLRMSMMLITHDLGVVAETADYGYVMYAGRIVEHAPVEMLLTQPMHPYTQGLLHCTPRLSEERSRLELIPGSVPDPGDFPAGCRFHPRCDLSRDRAGAERRSSLATESELPGPVLRRCVESYEGEPSGRPDLREIEPGHFVACWEVDLPTGVNR